MQTFTYFVIRLKPVAKNEYFIKNTKKFSSYLVLRMLIPEIITK